MDWVQFSLFFLGVFGLFLWNRAEGRADSRKHDQDNKELRRELVDVIRSIHEEMKDFHGRLERQDAEFRTRLISIEERRK